MNEVIRTHLREFNSQLIDITNFLNVVKTVSFSNKKKITFEQKDYSINEFYQLIQKYKDINEYIIKKIKECQFFQPSKYDNILSCGRLIEYKPSIPNYCLGTINHDYMNLSNLYLGLCKPIMKLKNQKFVIDNYYSPINRNNYLRMKQCYYIAKKLIKYTTLQPEQRSPEWFTKRLSYITASQVSVSINNNKYKTQLDALLENNGMYEKFQGNDATNFGEKFEPLAQLIYELDLMDYYKMDDNSDDIITDVHVYESAFINSRDPRFPFIGASPDGIVLIKKKEGNMIEMYKDGFCIEIKCPYRRTPNGTIPSHYLDQIQLQLETTNLEKCYFLDFKFYEFKSFDGFKKYDYNYFYKGAIIEFLVDETETDRDITTEYNKYYSRIYSNIEKPKKIKKWVSTTIENYIRENDIYEYKVTYWILTKKYYILVERNRNWLEKNIDKIREYWLKKNYYSVHIDDLYDML